MNAFKLKYIYHSIELQQEIEDFLAKWIDNSDSIETLTSGSTGEPKLISIKKEKMRLSARMTGNFLQIRSGEKALLCLSPSTIAGKMMLVRAMELELELYVTPTSSNPFEKITEEFDFVALVPLQLKNTLDNFPEKIQKCRNCIIGGGDIPYPIIQQLKNLELTVYHTFGMTETISHVAMKRVGFISDEYFTALGGTYFSNLDERLVIHSPLLETESITTNDCIELIDKKNFKWVGRTDFVINSGGIKIHPEVVENKLAEIISVPFFIIGEKDDYLGEKVILYIENKEDIQISKTKMTELLSRYEMPKEIRYVFPFARTDSGKINRLQTILKFRKNV